MTRQKGGNGKRGRGRGGRGTDGGGSGGRARGWARGRGRGIPPAYAMDESFDVNIQIYADGV